MLGRDPHHHGALYDDMKRAQRQWGFIHGVGPAHRHCIAAIRNTNFYELALVGPGVRNPVPPVFACSYSDQMEDVGADGCYPVPDGPGLGVEHDWSFIERNRIALHVFE